MSSNVSRLKSDANYMQQALSRKYRFRSNGYQRAAPLNWDRLPLTWISHLNEKKYLEHKSLWL